MPSYFFVWTEYRLEKLTTNGIDPDDFERIVMHPESRSVSRSTGRWIAFGRDEAGDELVCVYELDEEGQTAYPITGYYTGN